MVWLAYGCNTELVLFAPTESISSMKITHGARSFAASAEQDDTRHFTSASPACAIFKLGHFMQLHICCFILQYLCFGDHASLYNLVNKANLVHNLFFVYLFLVYLPMGTAAAQWLRCCATNWKVAGSIPAGVTGIFHQHKILPIALWSWGRLSL